MIGELTALDIDGPVFESGWGVGITGAEVEGSGSEGTGEGARGRGVEASEGREKVGDGETEVEPFEVVGDKGGFILGR